MTRIRKKKFGLRIHHNIFFFLEFLRKITSREIPEIFTIFFFYIQFFLKSEREEGKIAETIFVLCVFKAVEKIGRVAFFNFQSVVILSPE